MKILQSVNCYFFDYASLCLRLNHTDHRVLKTFPLELAKKYTTQGAKTQGCVFEFCKPGRRI